MLITPDAERSMNSHLGLCRDFYVEDIGLKWVIQAPWITVAETCEIIIALMISKRDEDAKFKQLEIFEDLTEDLSTTGKILPAADRPWLTMIFNVERDLTGWYANIIAARNEKKLFTLSSLLAINFPE